MIAKSSYVQTYIVEELGKEPCVCRPSESLASFHHGRSLNNLDPCCRVRDGFEMKDETATERCWLSAITVLGRRPIQVAARKQNEIILQSRDAKLRIPF